MTQRTRKLIGAAALLIGLPLYAMVAMTIGSIRLAGTGVLAQTIFFAIAGLIWVLPAGALITWMQRPNSPEQHS